MQIIDLDRDEKRAEVYKRKDKKIRSSFLSEEENEITIVLKKEVG